MRDKPEVGRHCPRCKRFLNKLDAALPEWVKHTEVAVVSADTEVKARAYNDKFGWSFDLCYGLSVLQMSAIRLYVTNPEKDLKPTPRLPSGRLCRPSGRHADARRYFQRTGRAPGFV